MLRGSLCSGGYAVLLLVLSAVLTKGDLDRRDAFIGYSEDAKPVVRMYLSIVTELGSFDILLLPELARATVEWLRATIEEQGEERYFYRAESIDKGYALVQGQFGASGTNLSVEAPDEPNVRGSVALIPGTSQFFISLSDHHDFDGSFTIFGRVVETPDQRGLNILSSITDMPIQETVDSRTGTVMQMLVKKIPFQAILRNEI